MLETPRRLAVFSMLLFGGTTALTGAQAAASRGAENFSRAVAVCRFFHGGRASQRANLGVGEASMQACLRQRGWWSDGTRTLDSQTAAER